MMERLILKAQEFDHVTSTMCWCIATSPAMAPVSASAALLGLSTRFHENMIKLMWAIAQRDGRPAEHRWRPLFNAAKFD